jgi:hypothetical protein
MLTDVKNVSVNLPDVGGLVVGILVSLLCKSFVFGKLARDIICDKFGKRHFKKSPLGTKITRYFYLPYRNVLPKYVLFMNIFLPMFSLVLLVFILLYNYINAFMLSILSITMYIVFTLTFSTFMYIMIKLTFKENLPFYKKAIQVLVIATIDVYMFINSVVQILALVHTYKP